MKRAVLIAIAAAAVAAVPWFVPESIVGSANLAATYGLIALSLVVLTGWVGQISLGHAGLVGVGAFSTGWIAGGFGIPFPASLPLAALVSGLVAAGLGMVALRVRGLYLAVATLVFSWMASEFLFRQDWFIRHAEIPDRLVGGEGWFPSFNFTDRRIFYLVAWAVLATAAYGAANLRDSKTGRSFFAVRGSEMAAASLGIDVVRAKLVAFATSGAIAGAAGNLLMSDALVVTADQFTFNVSLFYLAMAVVGGLSSLGGAVGSGLFFAGLYELFFRVRILGGLLEIVSGFLLALTLLAYKGGLASLGSRLAATAPGRVLRTVLSTSPRRHEAAPAHEMGAFEVPAETAAASNGNGHKHPARVAPPRDRESRAPLIEAEHVTVRFGGLTAVSDASLSVREGEIVGLIGPNGAGKTTLFNSIAGFNSPTEGTIRLYGNDVTALPIHMRARVGVARTFQQIQLFGQLSVYDNLLVATHVHNETGFWRNLVASDASIRAERAARDTVERVLRQLELEHVTDRKAADLPFGVLRMVEVARALVTGFKVMMLDEPASGLDNTETDRLMDIIRLVRDLGVTVLLIEHDVRMVTAVCDWIYVLNQGEMLANGSAEDIQRNPDVIAAYLGEPLLEGVG